MLPAFCWKSTYFWDLWCQGAFMNIDNLGVGGDGEEELHAEEHRRVLRCLQRAQYGLDGRWYKGVICMHYPLKSNCFKSLATCEHKDLVVFIFIWKGLVGGHWRGPSSAQCWGVLHPWKSGARVFCDAFDDDLGLMMMMTWAKQWLWWEWWCCCCQVKTTERLIYPSGTFPPSLASELSGVENQSKKNLTTGQVFF